MKKYFLLFCAFECAFSSVVNPNFYYQDYLDFALNKGKFKVGAKDIQIVSKGGKIINFDVPMVDFSATNFSGRLKGEFTNIGQSFVVSAAHMTWGEKGSGANKGSLKQGDTLYFANIANKVVAASNDFRSRNAYDIDFAVFKMQKLNLNISANMSKEFDFIKQVSDKKEEVLRYTDVLDDSKDFSKGKGKLFDTSRYSYFVREGSGIQGLGDIDITIRPEIISTDDNYHIGGFVNLNEKDKQELIEGRKRFLLPIANFNGNLRNDFTSSSAPGDSGSALYVYDNVDKKWYLIGVISTSDCNTKFSAGYNCTLVNYALINQPLIEEFKKLKSIKLANGDYIFENNTLKQSDKNIEGVEFISQENSGYIVFGNGSSIYHFHDRIKEMEKSKDLYFSQSGSILLKSDTDLGAGVLNFTPNSHWKILGDKWFINGGIYTDIGSKVIYDAKLKEDDYLYKMGQGELEIRSN
uniref:S6 family peptidase n=1 Tax=Campylobacter jejuni TaxID=197 RepID=UPI000A6F7C3A